MDLPALRQLLLAAACGRHPPADGTVRVGTAPAPGTAAVLAFTAHHVVLAAIDRDEILRQLPAGDLEAPLSQSFLAWLAARSGTVPQTTDVVLAAPPDATRVTGLELAPSASLGAHPRVRQATLTRTDVQVFQTADGAGVLVLGRGVAGRWEASIQVEPARRGAGLGRGLARAALALVPAGEPVFMQAAAGNAASIRAIVAAGYRPIGSEVLLLPPAAG